MSGETQILLGRSHLRFENRETTAFQPNIRPLKARGGCLGLRPPASGQLSAQGSD